MTRTASVEEGDKDKRIEELETLLQQHRTATEEVLQDGLSRIQQLQSALTKANQVAQAAVKEKDELSAYNKRLVSTYSTAKAQSEGATRTIQKQRTEIGQLKKALAEKEATLVETRMINIELREAAAHRLQELNQLQSERAENPVNDTDLLQLYHQQRQLFDLLVSTATCAMCFDPIPKNSAVSLKCGHTFCQSCIDEWERTSVRLQLQQAGHLGTLSMFETQCPECRSVFISVFFLFSLPFFLLNSVVLTEETGQELVESRFICLKNYCA